MKLSELERQVARVHYILDMIKQGFPVDEFDRRLVGAMANYEGARKQALAADILADMPVVRRVIEFDPNSKEDSVGVDLRLELAPHMPIDQVDGQVKSSESGIMQFIQHIASNLRSAGLEGTSDQVQGCLLARRLILINMGQRPQYVKGAAMADIMGIALFETTGHLPPFRYHAALPLAG